MPPTSAATERYATTEETNDAIHRLQPSDFTKLMMISRSFVRKRFTQPLVAPEDLLQEAILRTLTGDRRWRCSVSITRHLDRVMESVSGHVAQRDREARALIQHPDLHPTTPLHEPRPDTRFHARAELLHNIRVCFAEDPSALRVIRLQGHGLSASEIRQELGISRTEYDTITKRIRRRIVNFLASNEDH